jgi:TRAP-type mannitol/chloroaromatic compound transport system permease small subunit
LLRFSALIDALTERVGRATYWLILVAVLVSTANAVIRYTFNMSSNAWLEIQWYLFSAVFLFCAGYALLHNQHVRIDVISGRLSKRAQAWIDILGTVFFLMPMATAILWMSWPVFVDAYQHNEVSTKPALLLARTADAAHRVFATDIAGPVGTDQAHCVPPRPDLRPPGERA